MTKEQRFIMLVGLPGSGKSSVVKELTDGIDDVVVLSSDAIREELTGSEENQDVNSEVFAQTLSRTKQALRDGKHVVYDATNVSRKRRRGLLHQLPRSIAKIALYMATPYDTVIARNGDRERVVPVEVIERMYKTMQVPIYSEGWDKIVFEFTDETIEDDLPKQFTDAVRAGVMFGREGYELMGFLANYFHEEFFGVYDMPQDSKYHSFSVSRHIYYVYKHVLDNYEGEDKEMMLWTALLHDTGKAFCKNFTNRKGEETRYANFIGHDYVSSQLAIPFLKRMGFNDDFIHTVATLIQFHMYLLDKNASTDKLKQYVGEEMFSKLEFLREADTLAH